MWKEINMDTISGGEVLGIGAVAVAFGGLILKMWIDHTKLANKVTDAFEKNATGQQKLNDSVDRLKESVRTNTEVTRSTRDVMSGIIVNMMKGGKEK